MAQMMTSGKILREARERKGYELNTVARRLRIRPDILRAIEMGDFSSMPPRGYTRNMVNAYARLLGLNPTDIVNMYLDEAYAYQVEKARGTVRGSGFVMERESRFPRLNNRNQEDRQSNRQSDRNSRSTSDSYRQRDGKRRLYDDRTQFSRDDYGVTRERVERPGRSDRDFLSHHSGYSSYSQVELPDRSRSNRPRSGGRTVHVGQTPMEYSAPRFGGILNVFKQPGVLIATVVLAVLVIVALVFVLGGKGEKPKEDDVSKLPVSGITDTTGTSDQDSSTASVEIAPTSARVVLTVNDGDECYFETYTDGGDADPDIITGPKSKTLEVTGTWTITTYTPDYIKVEVNGTEQQFQLSEKYKEMYEVTVDFPKILEEWKSTHTSRDSQRQAAVAEATTAQQAQQHAQSASSASASSSD